jgi:pimeloyl-ACP methyl ester carboxylesterase
MQRRNRTVPSGLLPARLVLEVCLAFAILAAVLPLQAVAAGPPPAASQSPTCQDRRLILLSGLGSSSADAATTWSGVTNAVNGQVPYAGIDFFSYNSTDPRVYSALDSQQAIAQSVQALHGMVMREIAACPGVQLDLVGHSLGGVIAKQYLETYGPSTPEGSHIQHVATLDSPVNGISAAVLSAYVRAANIFGIDQSYLQSSPAVQDLLALFADPTTPQRNLQLAQSLPPNVQILTIGSRNDLVVPLASAVIPGFSSEFNLGTVSNTCPTDIGACVGHSQVLYDPAVMSTLVSFLQGQPQPAASH